MSYRLGIDVGGTFTDFVATDGDHPFKGKVPTVRGDESVSVLQAVDAAAAHYGLTRPDLLADMELIVLGTTVVTNTMLEYNGCKTGLITTEGFRDVIELRRGYRESLFDLSLPAPHPIVPRRFRVGVPERIDENGLIVKALDEEAVRQTLREFGEAGVEAIAVMLLFSFVNPEHERRVKEIAAEELPDVFVTLSSDVLPQIREFERVSTTVVNAYTSPQLKEYLNKLEGSLRDAGLAGSLLIMQSNGGVMDVAYSGDHGVDAVLSGPAGGVVAATRLGEQSGYRNVITADMGGTSYDVCLIHDGRPEVATDQWLSRYRIAVPLIDVHTIGSGGGSVAWVDSAGALRVGPESAGAFPGPACYGRGGERPTITDANVVLGYIEPSFFVGGAIELDVEAARSAIEEHVAKPLGMSIEEAAVGISRIANHAMSDALRFVSVSRGRDPRDYALMAFGGGGAISAGVQALDVGIKTILVPKNASVLSAQGGLMADFKVSRIRTVLQNSEKLELDLLSDVLVGMQDEAEGLLDKAGSTLGVQVDRFLDIRYPGQVQEVIVPLKSRTRRITKVNLSRAIRDFHDLHHQLYKFSRPGEPVEIVSARLELTGEREPVVRKALPFDGESSDAALVGERTVYFESLGFNDTRVYDGSKLKPGNLILGPAVIHEPDTTIVVLPNQEAVLDQFETYVIEVVE
ncbi:hydantoin utilization protein A [Aeromicrobium sp. Root344]|uniref:hydantoinase/oxoprolinase family protein n=1 Tax=Aeromicrobium sp. Root344 TaxID=1736521 RepID=UPI000701E372|nr:hydantoinase/oxoprolinase family protein [Aeromicrobium sp. Root344]KQV75371.1 hydantoin utilization protein A [Aeromicrobium sp. Root344]